MDQQSAVSRRGIVTFWQSGDNYGQQLQCWALQRYLKGIGHEPFLIRYLYKEPLWRKCLKLMAKTVLVYPLLRWWRHREVRRMEAVNRVKNKVVLRSLGRAISIRLNGSMAL